MRSHPVADIFPLLEGDELRALVDDIREHGLRVPIVLHHDGSILDGRNRHRACELAGIAPRFETWTGKPGGEVAYVVSLNLTRRQLDESQRSMVAAKIATLRDGVKKRATVEGGQICPPSQPEAAAALNVSTRSVKSARVVLDHGNQELVHAVEQGKIAVSVAARVARAPEAEQKRVVSMVSDGVKPAEAARKARLEEVKSREPHPPTGRYRVIYADPPWKYGDERAGLSGWEGSAAADHYPTMSTDDICAIKVESMAERDAVLLCWATFPLLPDALRVVASWGFRYKTAFVWNKGRGPFGHYHNAAAELLLVATRGSGMTPEVDAKENQVQDVPRERGHSTKPEHFRRLIDRLWPTGPRVELFRRGAKPDGWETWGNEATP